MAGTEALGTGNTDTKLAVLLERSQNTERFISGMGGTLTTLTEAINRVEKSQIEISERARAQTDAYAAEVKRIDALIVHKDQSSIARDKQQVGMINAAEAEWDQKLGEQQAQHDKDIAAINLKLDSMSAKLENSVFWNRIMAGVTALATAVAGGVITANVNNWFGR